MLSLIARLDKPNLRLFSREKAVGTALKPSKKSISPPKICEQDLVWQEIAANLCDEWAAAHSRLVQAEGDMRHLEHPEHKPLGMIGAALDFEDVAIAQSTYHTALALFTEVDERLRQCDDAQAALQEALGDTEPLSKAS